MNHAATLRVMRDVSARVRIKARVAAVAKRPTECDCSVCQFRRAIRGVVPEDLAVEVGGGPALVHGAASGRKH